MLSSSTHFLCFLWQAIGTLRCAREKCSKSTRGILRAKSLKTVKCSFGQHSKPALSSTHPGVPFHSTLSFVKGFASKTLQLSKTVGQWYVWLNKEFTKSKNHWKETNWCLCPCVFIRSGLGESSFRNVVIVTGCCWLCGIKIIFTGLKDQIWPQD